MLLCYKDETRQSCFVNTLKTYGGGVDL